MVTNNYFNIIIILQFRNKKYWDFVRQYAFDMYQSFWNHLGNRMDIDQNCRGWIEELETCACNGPIQHTALPKGIQDRKE